MLFSRPEVAKFINENFEPVWQSVRPVPTVSIDFGNGKKITRTLHGNIATYVCTSQGTVIDVLPGIYDPVTYQNRLYDLAAVAKRIADAPEPSDAIRYYHTVSLNTGAVSTTTPPKSISGLSGPSEQTLFADLLSDTLMNERVRRESIHNQLSHGTYTPAKLKKWLYRDVLHADLDDPYLGVDKVLSANYPFDDNGGTN